MDQSTINMLVTKSQNRDQDAYADLMALTSRFAYVTVVRMVGNPDDSRDIVQEGYIRAWTHLHLFNGQVTFQTWLFAILRNISIDWLRKKKVRQNAFMPGVAEGDFHHPEALLEASELDRMVREWIQSLPETQQLVFILRDLEDRSIRQVQEQTGLSESSIKSNLCVARKKLAIYLNKRGYRTP